MPISLARPPTQRGLSNRKRQGRGCKVNPEVIVRGLPPDPKRHWLRLLWKRKRHWHSLDAFTEYVQANHPHMLPEWATDVGTHMRCVLRGLYEST
jgi:hypothetical protein